MKKNIIWYKQPADFEKWEKQSLVIGNGYMGASFFGGISKEKIVLNEKTLWSGGPSPSRPDYLGGNVKDCYKYVKQVQKFLYEKRYKEAEELLPHLTGISDGYGSYQLLCNAFLRFPDIEEEKTEDYRRYLDMNNAVCTTMFRYENALHTRTAFASYPDNIICIKLSADKPSRISMDFELSGLQNSCEIKVRDYFLHYAGSLTDNGLKYAALFGFCIEGGEFKHNGKGISILNANEIIIYISAATDYAPDYPCYRKDIDLEKALFERIDYAEKTGWNELFEKHISDYKNLFDRVELSVSGKNLTDMPTDELFKTYRESNDANIRTALEELYYQFGRYALIASSRIGSLPANLQGVWNESNDPPWCSDYHINVNLQMNYWGAYNGNLAETVLPLIEFLNSMREAGRITAKEYYGIISDERHPENGWIAHTQTTPFGWTAPGWDFYWGWSTAAVAWLMQNLWEHFEFTGDISLLENKIYPIMQESARFYSQWLIYDDRQERLVSSPTYSPEHGPVTIGNTYEQSLIEQFYSDFIKASEILGIDEELRETVKKQLKMLKPYKVGENGLLLEWYEEEDADFDRSKIQPNHRHISHLLGLYPGKGISHDKPELMNAAINTLNDRGDESTGWARAYKMNLWARIGDANRAYKILYGLISESTYINLFDFHPPFQLDGNFGGSAGIAEMLLQSHEGFINPLPSLPYIWKNGSVKGLCARGGFTVNMKWNDGRLYKLKIKSSFDGMCNVKADVKRIRTESNYVDFLEVDGICRFNSRKNEVYDFEL